MTVLRTAYVEVMPKTDKFDGELSKRLRRIDASQEGARAGATFGRGFGERAGREAGGALQGAVGRLGPGLVAAFGGIGILEGFKRVIGGASDLNETISKTETVFAQSSGAIKAWASTSATALGQSKRAALDGASSFQNLFSQLGIANKEATGMSTTLVRLASDFASFHNAEPAEVMDALLSATRGEYDALQRFVPTVNAAAVETQALADSGKASADELTNAEKAVALYHLVVKDAGAATGDFARTADSAANQQRILMAQLEDTAASIGNTVLPAYQGMLGVVNDVGPGTIAAAAGVAILSNRIAAAADGTSVFDDLRAAHALYAEQVEGGTSRIRAALDTADVATVGLRGAASSLVGLFGGPWGIALTAATVGVGLLVKRHQEEEETNRRVIASGRELVGIYNDQGRAAGDAAFQRKLSEKEFAREYNSLRDLGVAAYDLQTAYAGNAEVQDQIIDQLRAKKDANKAEVAEMRQSVDANDADNQAIQERSAAISKQNGQIDDYISRLQSEWHGVKDVSAAHKDFAKQTTGSAVVLDQWRVALGKTTEASRTQATGVATLESQSKVLQDTLTTLNSTTATGEERANALKQAWDSLFGAAVNQSEANEAYEASVDALSQRIAENRTSTDAHRWSLLADTEAGRANRDAIEERLQKSIEMYNADVAAGVSVEEATRRHEARTKALETEAGKAGFNKEETRKLVEMYGQVPTKVNTDVTITGIEAVREKLREAKILQLALQTGMSADEAAGTLNRDAMWRQIHRAGGGPVYGPGGPTDDMVPAAGPGGTRYRLSNDEHIVTAAEVKSAGGHGAIMAWRRAMRDGSFPFAAGRAQGGPVVTWPFPVDVSKTKIPPATPPFGSGGGNIGWQRMWQALHAALPWAQLFSAYRPGDMAENGLSYHASGRAIDVTPDLRVVNWARSNWGRNLKELIYTPAGNKQVWNGKDHVFTGEALKAAHYNHVHLAMANGGVIPEPVVGVGRSGRTYSFGERGPETVTPGVTPAAGNGQWRMHPADIAALVNGIGQQVVRGVSAGAASTGLAAELYRRGG